MKNILSVLMALAILLSEDNISYPNQQNQQNWNILQGNNYRIWIGWLETPDIDWCRTITVLPYSLDKVSKMIEDVDNYHNIFDRVTSSDVLTNDVVHIRMDMPFPISDRDYIVKYSTQKEQEYISYKFKSVRDHNVPVSGNCIRLANAAGEWYLKEVDSSSTEVVYTWNGELAGDFPNWALTRAWNKQGNEMLVWLRESLEELYKE